jgi:hypothetical protein
MQALIDALRNRNAILFVGAGVSMNVGLPSWKALIAHLAERVGYDPAIFAGLGDQLTLAEYYRLVTGSLGDLRSWMDVEWHSKEKRENVKQSDIHRLLVTLPVPLIYTTNYDRYLEWSCEACGVPYVKVANVGDLVRLPTDKMQIVKFHGDFDDDGSLVLTESSYFDRMSFEGPLDIKLRADILGKTVLFVGYSLSDINVRYLLYKLHKLWQESAHATVKPSSYIFLTRPNAVQESVLKERGIEPIVSRVDDAKAGLKQFLEELHAQLK